MYNFTPLKERMCGGLFKAFSLTKAIGEYLLFLQVQTAPLLRVPRELPEKVAAAWLPSPRSCQPGGF